MLVALGTTLAAVGGWRYARASAPVPGPIIVISIDTLRADHLPIYGYNRIKTPAIDTLARDGIVFERAYRIARRRSHRTSRCSRAGSPSRRACAMTSPVC